jgi:hypothetical protein
VDAARWVVGVFTSSAAAAGSSVVVHQLSWDSMSTSSSPCSNCSAPNSEDFVSSDIDDFSKPVLRCRPCFEQMLSAHLDPNEVCSDCGSALAAWVDYDEEMVWWRCSNVSCEERDQWGDSFIGVPCDRDNADWNG